MTPGGGDNNYKVDNDDDNDDVVDNPDIPIMEEIEEGKLHHSMNQEGQGDAFSSSTDNNNNDQESLLLTNPPDPSPYSRSASLPPPRSNPTTSSKRSIMNNPLSSSLPSRPTLTKHKSSSRRTQLMRAQNQAGLHPSTTTAFPSTTTTTSLNQDDNNIRFAYLHNPYQKSSSQHFHSLEPDTTTLTTTTNTELDIEELEEDGVGGGEGIYEEYLHSLIQQQEQEEYKTAKCRRDTILICFAVSALSCLTFALVVTVRQNGVLRGRGGGGGGFDYYVPPVVVTGEEEDGGGEEDDLSELPLLDLDKEGEEKKPVEHDAPSTWLEEDILLNMNNEASSEPEIAVSSSLLDLKKEEKPSVWLEEEILLNTKNEAPESETATKKDPSVWLDEEILLNTKNEESESKPTATKSDPSVWLDEEVLLNTNNEESESTTITTQNNPSVWLDEQVLLNTNNNEASSESKPTTTATFNLYEDCSYEALSSSSSSSTNYQMCFDVCSPYLCCFDTNMNGGDGGGGGSMNCISNNIQKEECEIYKDCQGFYLVSSSSSSFTGTEGKEEEEEEEGKRE